jgi:hypothetical protein
MTIHPYLIRRRSPHDSIAAIGWTNAIAQVSAGKKSTVKSEQTNNLLLGIQPECNARRRFANPAAQGALMSRRTPHPLAQLNFGVGPRAVHTETPELAPRDLLEGTLVDTSIKRR